MTCNRFRGEPMTLREFCRIAFGNDNEYMPDPKIGERNNARRKADWDRRNSEVIDPGLVFACGDLEVVMCRAEPGCEFAGDLLCDWPVGRGRTCDLPLCATHARSIGPDRDLCPIHHALWVQKMGAGARLNPWPPRGMR
jgi:hypothetical protein